MEFLTEIDGSEVTVARICQRSGVHRTTLYRYFENLEDLHDRFLALYFQIQVGSFPGFPASRQGLAAMYKRIVAAMAAQSKFFLACYDQPRLAYFQKRWNGLVDEWLSPIFYHVGRTMDQGLRQPYFRFSLGVAHQYLEMALRSASAWSLDELTDLMIAFQWGGKVLLVDDELVSQEVGLAILDKRIGEHRRQYVPPS